VARRTGGSKRTRRRARGGSKAPRRPRSNAARLPEPPRGRAPGEWFDALVEVQKRLLGPGGCPWDREQTHDTLRPYLIEEAYEVLDALDSGDPGHIAEELGDLLLQVVFHAQLGAKAGRFDIADVIEQIHSKMVRRHPHVFGEVKADTAAQVLRNWDALKAAEKQAARGGKADQAAPSALDGVPRTLPALLEGYQLSRKASKVGFDWPAAIDIIEKLAEEIAELKHVLAPGNGVAENGARNAAAALRERQEDEFGDILFSCVNLGRFLRLDPEIALKKANLKFSRRFRMMERLAASRGVQLSALSADRLEELWVEAKRSTA
jgi:MazG family protein